MPTVQTLEHRLHRRDTDSTDDEQHLAIVDRTRRECAEWTLDRHTCAAR